jgi:small subunit ribosomal protein SAe
MNNRSPTSIGAGFFMLAKLINYIKGKGDLTWNMKNEIELFFYRDPLELEQLAEEQRTENDKAELKMADDHSGWGEEGAEVAAD